MPSEGKSVAKRLFSDAVELKFAEAAKEADAEHEQWTYGDARLFVESQITPDQRMSLKRGRVSKGMVRRWMARMEHKKTLGTATPTLDDTNRMKWKTCENFKNYYVDTAALAVGMRMGRLNTGVQVG